MSTSNPPEPLYTFKQAASLLNVPYFKLQRAAKQGLIPTYRLFNSRALVRLSDIQRLIDFSRSTSTERTS